MLKAPLNPNQPTNQPYVLTYLQFERTFALCQARLVLRRLTICHVGI